MNRNLSLKDFRRSIKAVKSIREKARIATRETKRCHICLEEEPPFLTPCACRGTQGSVHEECLNTWRCRFHELHYNRSNCRICREPYDYEIAIIVPSSVSIASRSIDPLWFCLFSFSISLLCNAGVLTVIVIFYRNTYHYFSSVSGVLSLVLTLLNSTSPILNKLILTKKCDPVRTFTSLLIDTGIMISWIFNSSIGLFCVLGLSVCFCFADVLKPVFMD